MKSHQDFERKIKRSLNTMEAKISFLHDGIKGLSEAFKDFHQKITEFMSFTADNYADHEKRISSMERRLK